MKCNNKCAYLYFRLSLPTDLGPICKKYMLPLLAAQDKCIEINKVKNKTKTKGGKTNAGNTKSWPGVLRGYGPITRHI